MRFPLLACALLAGCTEELPTGVTIAIEPVAGVATVELFMGDRVGGGLSGAPNAPSQTAELYEVAHANAGPWVVTLGKDEAFRFINDTDREVKIHMLAAVGYNAAGEPIAAFRQRDVYIQPGQTDYWTLILSPAGPIIAGDDPEDGELRVAAWQRDREGTMPSCVQIEHGHERYAFGPIGDRDCDALAPTEDAECAPWVYRAEGVAPSGGFSSAVCGAPVLKEPGYPDACLAGGHTCNEISDSNDTTCVPFSAEFCIPAPLCACTTWDATCIAPLLAEAPPQASHVSCSVCTDKIAFPEIDLSLVLGASVSDCNDVRIRELADTVGGLDDSADFPNSDLRIIGQSGCKVTLEWEGTRGNGPDVAIVSLDLNNGNHVVVPLYVRHQSQCDGTIPERCSVNASPSDPARWCAAPPPDTLCGGDPICSDAPWCGDRCCRAGETCEQGTCKCGSIIGGCADTESCMAAVENGCGNQCCGGNSGETCDP